MAAVPLMNSDPIAGSDPATDFGDLSALHRNIEFHIANKPYNGSSNNTNGFKMLTLNPKPDNSEPQKASGSDKKCDVSELADSGLDQELGFRITFRRIGAGLRNLGNTCFLNSVLQCLTYTEPLAAYLQSGKHRNSCRTAGFCALCAIQKHVSRALKSTGRILEPKDLVSNLRCISRNFRIARQEDAHEYMVNLLESMHKCCLPSGVPCESPSAYEKSLVHKIFGGRLRSQVKCMQCSFCSDKFDPFLDLSLEIMKADSLYKALTHFTAKEQLDGGAKQYQCQQCKQKVEAVRQLMIHDAPHVLTVHLKRFDSYVLGQKIDRKIEFGSTLDLKPFVSGPYDGDLNYTLYGVLVHAGWTTHSGHYYCFVRTSGGMWYSLDDNQVLHVSESRVLKQEAYMLFYVRDRKKSVIEKPVDALQKENIVKNGFGKEPDSKCNRELKENMQNGSSEMKLDDSISATLTDGDVLNGTAKEATSANVGSFERVTDTMTVECLPLKESTQSEPFPVFVLPNDSVMGTCSSNITSMDQLEKSASQVEVSGDAPALGNVQSEPFSVAPPKHTVGIISAANITSIDHLEESEVKVPSDASTLVGNTDLQPFSVIAPLKDTVSLVDRSDAPSLGNTTQMVSLSVIAPAKDSVQDISAANINSVNDLEKSVSLVKDTADASNLDHADKIVNCSNGDSAQQDVNAPAAVLPDSKNPQISLNYNELNDIVAIPNNCSKSTTAEEDQSKTLIEQPNSTVLCISSVDVCNMEGTDSRKCEGKAMSVKTNVEALTKTGFTKSLEKSIIDKSLVECSLRKSCDLTAEGTLDVSPKVIHFRSESVCGLPAIIESLLPTKVSKDPPLKVKKKAFKRQFAGMQLSSSIIFGVAQQKKNKRRKYLLKLKKNLSSENLLDGNDVPSDLGPSTSEKPLPASSGRSRRKRSNCGPVDKDKVSSALSSTSNCKPRRDINNEVSKRIVPNGTTVAPEKQPQKGIGCGSEPKQTAAEGRRILDGQRKRINDMMSMLTRGLESNIGYWNDTDIPMSKTTESREVETVQIGYIGDAWDEEYDRGKRKKVKRSEMNFCKPNLFQKFATKQNRKKSKLNRSSSGNQPFRI